VIVVDASVLVTALADDTSAGDIARNRLRGAWLAFPELAYVEVASVLRKLVAADAIDPRRAVLALDDLRALPAHVMSHRHVLQRCWDLRANLTMYDATYVALAEALNAVLLTADKRLARAPGATCPIEVLTDPAG
jgi:predicted nucleic acid-binding protein